MELKGMTCPKCGATLNFTEDQDFCFCSHCGTQVYKDEVNKQSFVYREINEAKIKEVELKEKELEFKERAQKRRIIIISAAVILSIIVVAFIYFRHGIDALWALFAVAMLCVMLLWSIVDSRNNKRK